MSKKDKISKTNKTEHSNNAVQSSHDNNTNLAHECNKENCTCTKHNNCGSLVDGE